MAKEALYDRLRPGYPKITRNAQSNVIELEYIGVYTDLIASQPLYGKPWGEWLGIVSALRLDDVEGTNMGILGVTVEYKFSTDDGGGGSGSAPTGDKREVTTEIDWVDVQRSMYEHPKFRIGGGGAYELTSEDISAIKQWDQMPDPNYKKDYIYFPGDIAGWSGGADGTKNLSDHAKMFARGMELGVEYYEDKAPVARISSNYVNGPPPTGTAGKKENPSGIPNLPTGYEWIRSTDRSTLSGAQASWTRDIEWTGAKKVLVDVAEIYWSV